MKIEILGRAVVPALELLSKQTGVTLQVAPENVETLGERKLTVIAQGCTLKALMVQIPKALQECHWDVVTTGDKPTYLLHRETESDEEIARLMSPLTESELHGAAGEAGNAAGGGAGGAGDVSRGVGGTGEDGPAAGGHGKDPEAKARLQLLLGLPPEQMEGFLKNGRRGMDYANAPEAYQQAARQSAAAFLAESQRQAADSRSNMLNLGWAKTLNAHVSEVGIYFNDLGTAGGSVSAGLRILRPRGIWGRRGSVCASGITVVPCSPRLPSESWREDCHGLLLKTGYSGAEADEVMDRLEKERKAAAEQDQEQKRAREWIEPEERAAPTQSSRCLSPSPSSKSRYCAPSPSRRDFSLVSDYFTAWRTRPLSREAQAPAPAWRVMYLLGEEWFWTYDWSAAGQCAALHDRYWYRQVAQELPESMVEALRATVKEQGRFTFEDIVAATVELQRRNPVPPALSMWYPNVPSDLQKAGLWGSNLRSETILLGQVSPRASWPKPRARRACPTRT